MNKQTLTILSILFMGLFFLVSPSASEAQEIVIVNSSPIKPYQEAINAFNNRFGNRRHTLGIQSIQPYQIQQLDLSKNITEKKITRKLQTLQPKLILAVGSKALKLVANFPAPIIYLMVSNPQRLVNKRNNIGGIKMLVAASAQLIQLNNTFPQLETLGEIYNPESNGPFFNNCIEQNSSIKIIAEPITSPKKLKIALQRFASKIDALWLPPDPTIISPTTLDLLALYSLENNVPLIAFAPKYLKYGAAMAIYSRPRDMGEQAAELALRLLTNPTPDNMPQEHSTTARIVTSTHILKTLGLTRKELP